MTLCNPENPVFWMLKIARLREDERRDAPGNKPRPAQPGRWSLPELSWAVTRPDLLRIRGPTSETALCRLHRMGPRKTECSYMNFNSIWFKPFRISCASSIGSPVLNWCEKYNCGYSSVS